MVSRNIQADVLSCLSDGKKHTCRQIAEDIEVHPMTVYKHIKALSYRYNIDTFCGGIERGGVQLKIEQQVSVERLNCDELQFIVEGLKALQSHSPNVKSFINKLNTLKEIKELDNEKNY